MAMYILHKPGVNLIGAITPDTFAVVNDPFTSGDPVSECDRTFQRKIRRVDYSWRVKKNKESAHEISRGN